MIRFRTHIRHIAIKSFLCIAVTLPLTTAQIVNRGTFAETESPSGTANGVNPTFSLAATPNPATGLLLSLNGLLQKQGLDYTLAGKSITFFPASIPQTGALLLASYQTGIGDIVIDGGTSGNSGGLFFKNSNNANGGTRNNSLISATGGLAGRMVNRNTDLLDGAAGYGRYDNAGTGHVSLLSAFDSQAPNSSGQVLSISYDGKGSPSSYPGPTPGYGGFYIAVGPCTGPHNAVNGYCYREGNRYLIRMWAKIPSGYTVNFGSNGYGNGGTYVWITSNAGAGDWRLYEAIQTIGIGGTLSTTGFWYIDGGPNSAFSWSVANLEMVGLDESPTVQNATSLNVGFSQGTNLDFGQLLSANGTYLAVSGGNVGIGTTAPRVSGTGKFHQAGNTIRVVDIARTPVNASEPCNFGEIALDSTHLYVCSATNFWRSILLGTL